MLDRLATLQLLRSYLPRVDRTLITSHSVANVRAAPASASLAPAGVSPVPQEWPVARLLALQLLAASVDVEVTLAVLVKSQKPEDAVSCCARRALRLLTDSCRPSPSPRPRPLPAISTT